MTWFFVVTILLIVGFIPIVMRIQRNSNAESELLNDYNDWHPSEREH